MITEPPTVLVLASQSPRRKDILTVLGIPFQVMVSSFKEASSCPLPLECARSNAQGKVSALLTRFPELQERTVLGADTCIDLDGSTIGKPKNRDEAREMLTSFSGREHQVITALSFYTNGAFYLKTETTTVRFAPLKEGEIEAYLNHREWAGVAGGYRIQGRGAVLIDSLKGCYFNVMGLPIRLFYGMVAERNSRLLEEWGFLNFRSAE